MMPTAGASPVTTLPTVTPTSEANVFWVAGGGGVASCRTTPRSGEMIGVIAASTSLTTVKILADVAVESDVPPGATTRTTCEPAGALGAIDSLTVASTPAGFTTKGM